MGCDDVRGQALVVGAPGKYLHGVEHDARRMAEMLRHRGFAVEVCTGERATRAGILAGYDRLIANARRDEPCVVYYSGHGFRAFVDGESQWWQGISPIDITDSTTADFRGITAWELSIKQAQLTERTRNVTVILDCCFAAQMSRDAAVHDAVPKALPHPVRLGFAAHQQALRDRYRVPFDAAPALGNADAVRLVACGEDECAYECPTGDGQYGGVFTAALLDVLQEVDGATASWAALRDAIRARVQHRFPIQRPDIEGPAQRRIFSLDEDDDCHTVAVSALPSGARLGTGKLMGVTTGDLYAVMPSRYRAYDPGAAIATVEVSAVFATSADAAIRSWHNDWCKLAPDAVAVVIEKQAARHSVSIAAPDSQRATIAAAIDATRTLRVADADSSALAMVRLTGAALTIEDRGGPIFPATRFPDDLRATVHQVASLGAARRLRELEGEHGVSASEVAIEWGAVDSGRQYKLPDHGSPLALQDRVYVRVTSTARRTLYAHVLNIGLRGHIKLLTRFAPSGVKLTATEPVLVLGMREGSSGLRPTWPNDLPRDGVPRVDELIVIATSVPVNLGVLETTDLVSTRAARPRLESLFAQACDGAPRSLSYAEPSDDFLMRRLSYFLHPKDAALASIPFIIDDDPLRQAAMQSPNAWYVGPLREDAPAHRAQRAGHSRHSHPAEITRIIEIRLADLVVHRTSALSRDIRIDALVCTRSSDAACAHVAWTRRYCDAVDGVPLDRDSRVVFRGPVHDFVDIYVWISRHTEHDLDLAELLAQPAGGRALHDLAGALRINESSAPWIASAATSSALARLSYEHLREAGRPAIGLYRSSFTSSEGFGIGRHPAQEVHRSAVCSFSVLIDAVLAEQPDR